MQNTDTLNREVLSTKRINSSDEKEKLFVFVGQRISVDTLSQEANSMDIGFIAKYKVIQQVYGNLLIDTIEFKAYDHYGLPAFSRYKNALLYVSEDNGKYYHQKYQYNDVYETVDGRWASPYDFDGYGHPYNKNTSVKPEKIRFKHEVSYPTYIIDESGKKVEVPYPEPYFKIIGNKAIAVYGNYVEELFILKKEGVLAARGIFERQDDEYKYESNIVGLISALSEVKRCTTCNTVFIYERPGETRRNYYWVKVGHDNGLNVVTQFNFYVDSSSQEIKYLDVRNDKVIMLDEWRKQMK